MSEVKRWTGYEISRECSPVGGREISYFDSKFVHESDHLAAMEAKDKRIAELEDESRFAYDQLSEQNLVSVKRLLELEAKDREIELLKSENTAMYGAILEAADSGSIRCKLELQRIAAEDANMKHEHDERGWQPK